MRSIFVLFFIFILSVSFISCNNGSQGYEHKATGNIALQVSWPEAAGPSSKNQMSALIDCSPMNVGTISAVVFSDTHEQLRTGGPWDCAAGSGTIREVPASNNLRVRLSAFDLDDNEVYRGEAPNVSVQANQTAHVDIRMEYISRHTVSMVQGVNPGIGSSFPHSLVELQNQLCFVALGADTGFELFSANTDGGGAQLVQDFYPADDLDRFGVMAPTGFVELNGWLYFRANNGGGFRVWRTQGTTDSTEMVAASANYYNPNELTVLNDKLFFSAESIGSGRELWVFEESSGQARQVAEIRPGQAGSNPEDLTVMGTELFFAADDGVNGCELWQTNADAESCQLVWDIRSGAQGSDPRYLTVVNDRLFFVAYDGPQATSASPPTHGRELGMLWHGTDGFEVQVVADINDNRENNSGGSSSKNLTCLNGTILAFSAYTPENGQELYLYDWQTDTAPRRITDLNPSNASSYPSNFVYLNGTLYFSASNGSYVNHLYAYCLGQQTLTCLTNNLLYPSPRDLTVVKQTLYFSASHQSFGRCLWATDGNRTSLVISTNSSKAQHSPSNLMAASNGGLYYSAFDGDYGEELFLLNN